MKEQTDWQKYPLLFSLYIAQAIPMSFFSTVVPVIMRQENYSLESIGLLQLIKLPWVLKFLWAPLVDNNAASLQGYKRWIYGSEIFYALVVFSIGFLSLQTNFSLVIILMLLAVVASATQDIATDAFAILILKKKERGYGNSMQSAGGFAGNLIGSGLLLIIFYYLGWQILLFCLALFVLAALIPLGFYRKEPVMPQVSGKKVQLADLWRFMKIPGMYKWLLVLFFYSSGIVGIMAMLKPWLVDLNYSTPEIGLMVGIHGTAAALVASLFAGFLVKRRGYYKAMYFFLVFSIMAGAFFWYVSQLESPPLVAVNAAILLLWTAYGCSMVAIYTAAMDMVRPGKEGTDFTLQIVITHLSGLVISVFSGKLADVAGYTKLFGVQTLMSFVALILLIAFRSLLKKNEQVSSL
jgi:predicted MFS family arabinose efflux permease